MIPSTEAPEHNYSDSIQALDEIVSQLKSDSLTLESALELFEAGIGHLKNCQTKLTGARGQVDELVKTLGEGGEIVTRPFEEA